jgi:hypothetical protein
MRKLTFALGLLIILIMSGFYLLQKDSPKTTPAPHSACSEATVATCPKKAPQSVPGEMLLDNMSRQFLVLPSLSHY